MNFTLSEEHLALRDAARTFLSKEVKLDPFVKLSKKTRDELERESEALLSFVEGRTPSSARPRERRG